MPRQRVTRRRPVHALALGAGALALTAGAAQAQPASSDLVEKGRYLATATEGPVSRGPRKRPYDTPLWPLLRGIAGE